MVGADYVPVVRGGGRAGFPFTSTAPEEDGSWVIARFTDDAGPHWQLDNRLHLEQIAERDDL